MSPSYSHSQFPNLLLHSFHSLTTATTIHNLSTPMAAIILDELDKPAEELEIKRDRRAFQALEEAANFFTHAASVPAVAYTFFTVQLHTNSHQSAVMALYGWMMLSLFVVSAIYHLFSMLAHVYPEARWFSHSKKLLRIADRSMIHLYIAACYTPWLMLRQNTSPFAEEVCKAVWICAALSILAQNSPFTTWATLQSEGFVIGTYLLLGVLPGTFICAFATDYTGIPALAGGGLLYVVGLCFYFAEGRFPFAHAIWHLFVNVGTFVHYQEMNEYLEREQALTLERMMADEQATQQSWMFRTIYNTLQHGRL